MKKKFFRYQTSSNASSAETVTLEFTQETLDAIRDEIGQHPAERGGILGSNEAGIICKFFHDSTAKCSGTEYSPDTDLLNKVLREWKKEGIKLQGVVHSHPPGCSELSRADKEYVKEIMSAFKGLKHLALPLVMTEPDSGEFQLIPFVAVKDGTAPTNLDFQLAEIAIKQVSPHRKGKRSQPTNSSAASSNSEREQARISYFGRFPSQASRLFDLLSLQAVKFLSQPCDADFETAAADTELALKYSQRVQTAYDLSLLNQTRLVVIGAGGAAQFIRDCARAGFGEFVLGDHDVISESNVATQSADPAKLGVAKVDALAADIRSLNPTSAVIAVQTKLENLTDADLRLLCTHPIRGDFSSPSTTIRYRKQLAPQTGSKPKQTILLVLTDSFEAQARGHRFGLNSGLSTICAQEYREGRGAEVTFTVPGVTPACHRCITASRYKAFLSNGYRNDVTSDGAPIFAAQMLNAALGHVTLAVAHHGTDHPRFGSLISRFGKRNLILLRMDPDFDAFMGWPAFSGRLAGATDPNVFMMLDSIFLPQGPDRGQTESRPVCPDCGGSGDLRNCIGTFSDTRPMRAEKAVHFSQNVGRKLVRKRN
jgi:proteasome lid subunit RPN8/RPN11